MPAPGPLSTTTGLPITLASGSAIPRASTDRSRRRAAAARSRGSGDSDNSARTPASKRSQPRSAPRRATGLSLRFHLLGRNLGNQKPLDDRFPERHSPREQRVPVLAKWRDKHELGGSALGAESLVPAFRVPGAGV